MPTAGRIARRTNTGALYVGARATLGDHGRIDGTGVAYAWCEREALYHYTLPRAFVSFDDELRARTTNGQYEGRERAIARPTIRTRQLRADVRVGSMQRLRAEVNARNAREQSRADAWHALACS